MRPGLELRKVDAIVEGAARQQVLAHLQRERRLADARGAAQLDAALLFLHGELASRGKLGVQATLLQRYSGAFVGADAHAALSGSPVAAALAAAIKAAALGDGGARPGSPCDGGGGKGAEPGSSSETDDGGWEAHMARTSVGARATPWAAATPV